jgi:hypothetical protein
MTWQGTITFLDTNQKIPFRSVLELLKLMDSAINPPEFNEDVAIQQSDVREKADIF